MSKNLTFHGFFTKQGIFATFGRKVAKTKTQTWLFVQKASFGQMDDFSWFFTRRATFGWKADETAQNKRLCKKLPVFGQIYEFSWFLTKRATFGWKVNDAKTWLFQGKVSSSGQIDDFWWVFEMGHFLQVLCEKLLKTPNYNDWCENWFLPNGWFFMVFH